MFLAFAFNFTGAVIRLYSFAQDPPSFELIIEVSLTAENEEAVTTENGLYALIFLAATSIFVTLSLLSIANSWLDVTETLSIAIELKYTKAVKRFRTFVAVSEVLFIGLSILLFVGEVVIAVATLAPFIGVIIVVLYIIGRRRLLRVAAKIK